MGLEQGKVFIGGISWETTEQGLKDHFKAFGDVVDAMVMKDRSTGRSRGFGFVIFSDSAVAERVVQLKHTIDGRTVEAKKAVPKEDQQSLTRTSSGDSGPALQTKTKKVFVGGLASTVTEKEFREYFEQFGTIVDVVVIYDPNTQRPRGFGFITYDSEDAVDNVMQNTFHELKGKVVEVKKAIPKELSISLPRSPAAGLTMAAGRGGNSSSGFRQVCSSNPAGNSRARMDIISGHSPGETRGGGFGICAEYWPGMVGGCGCNGLGNISLYGGLFSYAGNGKFSSPTVGRNMWSNGGIGCGNTETFTCYGAQGGSNMYCFGGARTWGSSPTATRQAIDNCSVHCSGSYGFGIAESSYGSVGCGDTRQSTWVAPYSSSIWRYAREGSETNDSLGNRDLKLKSSAPKSRGYLPIGYGFGSTITDLVNYNGSHEIAGRETNTGVAV